MTILRNLLKARVNAKSFSLMLSCKSEIEIKNVLEMGLENSSSVLVNEFVDQIKPRFNEKSNNIAAYARDSTNIQRLVDMGVNVSQFDHKYPKISEYLIKQDFDTAIGSKLDFLTSLNIKKDELPIILNKNPFIYNQSVRNMKVRVLYFLSKKFTKNDILLITSKEPRILNMELTEIDERLGFIQKSLRLKAVHIRQAVVRYPKILLCRKENIQKTTSMLADVIKFNDSQVKMFFKNDPKLFNYDPNAALKSYTYLTTEMNLSNDQIVKFSICLRKRANKTTQRFLFVKSLFETIKFTNENDLRILNHKTIKQLILNDKNSEISKPVTDKLVSFFKRNLKWVIGIKH
ncbi:Transcription termination factor 3, mitochondrial [Intoshia linei]|uniref:Transcription termination factor 3, mitochondrial n=1 Tax=Intoshia linei TaxID=1819745 RepID=A0A177B253_9BILA|nr:Transcription termination factor 3, mitochondrial [Intoshia linei]